MEIPEYIPLSEVRRVCQELGLSDWTQLDQGQIDPKEALLIQEIIGAEALEIPDAAFQQGLEVELEHGLAFPDANVTNNHPLLTGKIVLAHLKESLDYYARLEVAELEGDLFKALLSGDQARLTAKYRALVRARYEQIESELQQLA